MYRSLAACLSLACPAALAQQAAPYDCLPEVGDMAQPGHCIPASSVPVLGALLPLGSHLFVEPTGEVGIGTLSPQAQLDVEGSLRVAGRAILGGAAMFGPSQYFDWLLDLSVAIDDFSSAQSWAPIRSYVLLDPAFDQTGPDARYVYSHDFIVRTAVGSDVDFEYIQGPYMLALQESTGTAGLLVGAFIGAENNHGHVELQGGSYNISVGDWESTTVENAAGEFQSGHYGASGWIENDHGIYVYSPYTASPLTNHYGIYLEDPDFGVQDSFALYSAGGTSYFEGSVGIGTDAPTAKLDVDGDFVASGTKSFAQPHPTDPGLEVRFVCLEGNEAGTYFRGEAKLVRGECVIDVPEDFAAVTEAEGITVQVTARGPGADLWVASKSVDRIVVRGAKDVAFDYFVQGVRAGYADFQTIRPRTESATNAGNRDARTPERQRHREARQQRQRGR
ncbi:MAG: hypothetical protein AAF726_19600 [Planctomycetota bacterium]